MKLKHTALLLVALLLPIVGMAKTKAKTAPQAQTNRLTRAVKVWAYSKDMGAASKVKNVFKKDAPTITVKMGFQNLSGKEIRASRGILRFTTFFGEGIYDLSWEAVMPIAPGQSASMEWKLKRANFASDEAFEKFKKTPLDKMQQTWWPTVVVFADGTRLKP